jgi:outer membrane protein OmpA-like peptidoglycan-associated protein
MNMPSLSRRPIAKPWFAALCCSAAIWLVGCATQVPSPPMSGVPLPQAVDSAVDYLMSQTGSNWMSAFERRTVVVEPVRDSSTGQQTISTREAGNLIDARLRKIQPNLDVLPFRQTALSKARWLITAKLAPLVATGGAADKSRQLLQLSLSEIATGVLIGESSVLIVDKELDNTPTTFFQDSPVMTTAVPAMPRDPSSSPAKAVLASAMIDEAMADYDAGKYSEAHALFTAAQKLPDADMLSVNTGLYLVYTRLGQTIQANDAFGRMAAEGIARRTLAVKFLFEPGKVEFWADPTVSGPYAMWIGQIARQAANSGSCISIVGHSSHTGTEEYNDELSLARATHVGELLTTSAADATLRLRASGVGFHQNLIGTGTDDIRDALDRRVEFKFSDCAASSANVSTKVPG